MKRISGTILGAVVSLAVFCSAATAQSAYFGIPCPGTWVNNGGGMMCRCPNGGYANMIGGRVVCPNSARPRRRTACPQGYYSSRGRCVKVGQFICPSGRHACPSGDTCTATGCRPAGASACPQTVSKFCKAPLTCATDLNGSDQCFTNSQLEALNKEKQTRDVISTIDKRTSRLQEVNRAFQKENGMSYGEKIQRQRAAALKKEKDLPAAQREKLQEARRGTAAQLEKYADGLEKQARQEVAYEAPLRVALNPDLSNPAKQSRLTPSRPAKPKESVVTPKVQSGPINSTSTFAPLTRERLLRQQLEAERARAKAIDDRRAKLLLAEIPFRTAVVAGSAAADKLGLGTAYGVATEVPGVVMGQTSTAKASGNVAGGYVGGKILEKAGAPPGIGTAATAVNQGVDWFRQWRLFQATRTR